MKYFYWGNQKIILFLQNVTNSTDPRVSLPSQQKRRLCETEHILICY